MYKFATQSFMDETNFRFRESKSNFMFEKASVSHNIIECHYRLNEKQQIYDGCRSYTHRN